GWVRPGRRSRPRPRFYDLARPSPALAFLFRRRTFFLLLGAAAMLAAARPRPALYAAGLVLAVLGVAIRLWAAGTIHKGREITTSGPYAWVRHPLYVGSFVIALGYFAMSGLWEAFAIGIPLFLLLNWAAVVIEERMLAALFGPDYDSYCRRVPRAVPRPPRGPAKGDFSWSQALYNREPLHIAGVIILSALFALIMLYRH